jgi:O-antigen ligase
VAVSRGLSARWALALGLGAAAIGLGVLVGADPALGLAVTVALAFGLLMLDDLSAGVALFTVVSFLDVIQAGSASGAKIAGIVLLFSWLAATAVHGGVARNDFFKDHPRFVFLIVSFLAWGALSASWAASPSTALSGTGRFALDIALFPIVYSAMRKRDDVIFVIVAFIVGALVSVAFGIVGGTSEPTIAGEASRVAGAVGEANETATVLVAAVVLSAALLGTIRSSSPTLRLVALLGGLLALAGLFTTVSRAGFIALGVALLVGAFVGGRWRGRLSAFAIVTVTGTLVYLFAFAPTGAAQRLESSDSSGRSTIWQVAWRVVDANPVKGVGADNFSGAAVHYLVRPGASTRADLIVDTPKVAHNIYLETWADLGIVGLVMLLAIILTALRCALLAARRFSGRDPQLELVSRVLIIAIVSMLSADFFASAQYSKQLWLLLALCPALLALSRTAPDRLQVG